MAFKVSLKKAPGARCISPCMNANVRYGSARVLDMTGSMGRSEILCYLEVGWDCWGGVGLGGMGWACVGWGEIEMGCGVKYMVQGSVGYSCWSVCSKGKSVVGGA